MSATLAAAIVTGVAVPIIAGVIAAFRALYSDNRASWRQRAEAAEAEKQELKAELLPAVRDLAGGLGALAEGQEEERKLGRKVMPALRRIEKALADQAKPGGPGKEDSDGMG